MPASKTTLPCPLVSPLTAMVLLFAASTLAPDLLVPRARGASAASPAAAGGSPGFDPANPDTWRLSAKLARGSPLRRALIAELTRPSSDPNQVALTEEEAEALLDDPRAQRIYGAKTISVVAPSMVRRQRKGHQDLLKTLLAPQHLAAGVAFYDEHAAALERAGQRRAVRPEVIVSILMWETRLGTVTGDFFAFNSFASQAFFLDEAHALALKDPAERRLADTRRQAKRVRAIRERARANLVALVRSCKAQGADPLAAKGSWAGALGYPQFMPASLRFAEDGNGDGKVDLFDFADAIFSVARYLGEHGFAADPYKAVYAYNHDEAYAKGVLAWADALASARAAAKAPAMPAAARQADPAPAPPDSAPRGPR